MTVIDFHAVVHVKHNKILVDISKPFNVQDPRWLQEAYWKSNQATNVAYTNRSNAY